MARQRQRARDRKQRRANTPGPAPTEPHRENVPGPLDHASGAEEEFEAGIVAGAGGVPYDEDESGLEGDDSGTGLEGDDSGTGLEGGGAGAAPPARRGRGGDGEGFSPRTPGAPTTGGGNRFVNFLRASWAELQRVQWPDRRQVGQATAVVLGFVIIAGAYLGLADAVAQKIVDFIL